jgi:hypothetical protein
MDSPDIAEMPGRDFPDMHRLGGERTMLSAGESSSIGSFGLQTGSSLSYEIEDLRMPTASDDALEIASGLNRDVVPTLLFSSYCFTCTNSSDVMIENHTIQLKGNTNERAVVNDSGNSNDCNSREVEGCNTLEVFDDALEAAADGMRGSLSLNSIGIIAPNCC